MKQMDIQDEIKRGELHSLITQLYGEERGRIKKAATFLDVNYANLRGMLKGRIRVPSRHLSALEGALSQERTPKPPRDDASDMGLRSIKRVMKPVEACLKRAGWSNMQIALAVTEWAESISEG